MIIDRPEVPGLIRRLQETGPAVIVVHGPEGAGRTFAVRQACLERGAEGPLFWLTGRPEPAVVLARTWADALLRQGARLGLAAREEKTGATESSGASPWEPAFRLLGHVADLDQPTVVVLDDADLVLDDRRFAQGLASWWSSVRARTRPVHLLLVGRGPRGRDGSDEGARGRIPQPSREMRVEELGLREVAATVPTWSPVQVVETYAMVGGLPAFWDAADTGRSPLSNLARSLAAPGSRVDALARRLLPPSMGKRTRAVLHALARGARTWGEVRREAGIFRTSSELGPYMKQLEESGLVRADRSLDALPGSRRRRYEITRPFLEAWLSVGLPAFDDVQAGRSREESWRELQGTDRERRLQRRVAQVVRRYLVRYGDERLPGSAREVGGLWGDGFDLPASGTLTSGGVVYGTVAWDETGPAVLDAVTRQMRETRYGFGREARIPLVVTALPAGHALGRRAAQVEGSVLLSAGDLLGRSPRR